MSRRGHEAAQHSQEERGLDKYPTPPEAVRALMGVEALPEVIWENACGAGNIVLELRKHGRRVLASDIEDQGCPSSGILDFMHPDANFDAPKDAQAIVTNPPFYLLRHGWVARCLSFCPDVYLLARLQFLEGSSEWRQQTLEKSGLRRIYVFRDRLPMMHRANWDGPKASSRMAFAWFCWRRGWTGLTSVKRISWKNPGPPLPPKGAALPKALPSHPRYVSSQGDGLMVTNAEDWLARSAWVEITRGSDVDSGRGLRAAIDFERQMHGKTAELLIEKDGQIQALDGELIERTQRLIQAELAMGAARRELRQAIERELCMMKRYCDRNVILDLCIPIVRDLFDFTSDYKIHAQWKAALAAYEELSHASTAAPSPAPDPGPVGHAPAGHLSDCQAERPAGVSGGQLPGTAASQENRASSRSLAEYSGNLHSRLAVEYCGIKAASAK